MFVQEFEFFFVKKHIQKTAALNKWKFYYQSTLFLLKSYISLFLCTSLCVWTWQVYSNTLNSSLFVSAFVCL